MKIALIDSFADTSHLKWAKGFQEHSRHKIDLYISDAHNWKWKMTGGTYELIDQLNSSAELYDLLLVTDMVNLPLLQSNLKSELSTLPVAIYFHENQITYPWSPDDQDVQLKRDHHYGWINYTSARLANRLFFNSEYHITTFISALPNFLSQFPTFDFENSIVEIMEKSKLLHIGMDLPDDTRRESDKPIFIWNHRWEYDKNPELFFRTLIQLSEDGFDFELIVMGRPSRRTPHIFQMAKTKLQKHIIQWGWVESEEYKSLLQKANIALVTNDQDFFGISVVEAIASGLYPILPKRLAYPEHIPKELHGSVFYESDQELNLLLQKVLTKRDIPKHIELREHVSRYDWKNIINHYDRDMEALKIGV